MPEDYKSGDTGRKHRGPRPRYRSGKGKQKFAESAAFKSLAAPDVRQTGKNQTIQTHPQEGVTSPLFDRLCEWNTLKEAWLHTRKGRTLSARRFAGSADRVSLDLYERHLERNLNRLRYRLLTGRYHPDPISRFQLPKADGTRRTLAVLTVNDRIVQRAALTLLEPLFEPQFLHSSYAFRPDLSTADALEQVEIYYRQGLRYVVDADIEKFFDRIDRTRLVGLLAEKIKDRRLMTLLRLWIDTTETAAAHPTEEKANPEPDRAKHRPPSESTRMEKFTRSFMKGGLDWGIEQLSGEASYRYGYSPYAADRWSQTDDYEEEGDWPQRQEKASEQRFRRESLRRIGLEGSLLSLSVARGLLKHGVLPGSKTVGTLLKVGTVLGTAGGLGVLGWRGRSWLKSNEGKAQKLAAAAANLEMRVLPHYVAPGRRGIVQGSILSPFLSNIYLHEFDCQLNAQGLKLVRFADDVLIVCISEREASAALNLAEKILAPMGLNFNPSKTRVCKLEKGFKFLGAELGADGQWLRPELLGQTSQAGQSTRTRPGRASEGWLKHTARLTSGIVQKGRPSRPPYTKEENE